MINILKRDRNLPGYPGRGYIVSATDGPGSERAARSMVLLPFGGNVCARRDGGNRVVAGHFFHNMIPEILVRNVRIPVHLIHAHLNLHLHPYIDIISELYL